MAEQSGLGQPTSPSRYPASSSMEYPGTDYSFTLQAIMELQKNVGGLQQQIKSLNENITRSSQKMDQKMDDFDNKIDKLITLKNKIIGGAIVLGVAMSVIAFLLEHFVW